MKKLSPIALALALAFPMGAHAQSAADMQKQIDMLKAQIAELKQMVAQKAAAPAGDDKLRAEVAQMRVKMDAMDDAQQESGFAGIKLSGFIDPTYIYSKRAGRGDFVFLNGDSEEYNNHASDAWGYTNANFGGATLKIEKTFENDMLAVLKFRPYKSPNNEWVEEAYVSMPMNGFNAVVGKRNSFNGYESVDAADGKLVTHNLLYDFGGPLQMIGVGADFSAFGMDWMTIYGNMNETRDLADKDNHSRGFHWRGDLEVSEFLGFGFSGMHGTWAGQGYNYVGADMWYTRGDLNINGQVEWAKHRKMAFNGKDASHIGVSTLASYNLGDGWEVVGRADWMDEHKNGGSAWRTGIEDDFAGSCLGVNDVVDNYGGYCGDYRSGFGPAPVNSDGSGGLTSKGPRRSALTLGLNYMLNEWALLKFEIRHDRSDINSFYDWTDKSFKKSNTTFGAQTVVKF